MPLAFNVNTPIRAGGGYGYKVAPGIHVYAGALLMLNAAGTVQRVQDAGGVAFAGMSDRELDNSASTTASTAFVVAQRGLVVGVNVPAAIPASVGLPVYATDDATLTLTSNSGANPQVGTLNGFENGNTWVKLTP